MTESVGFQLMISTFTEETTALKAVSALHAQFKADANEMPAVASVVRAADGSLTINESSDIGGKEGAAAGAVIGGLIGLFSRRASVVSTAAIGALLGGVVAKKADTGIPDPRLEAIGQALDHASSAAVAIVRDSGLAKARAIVDGLGATTVSEPFDHKADFTKRLQSGDYTGALSALANKAEGTVAGATNSASSAASNLMDRDQES